MFHTNTRAILLRNLPGESRHGTVRDFIAKKHEHDPCYRPVAFDPDDDGVAV